MANNVISIENNPQSQKPSSSAFKQQKLPAWQPILTAGTVLPTFFLIGVAFIPIGIGLLLSSNQVQEFQVDYTFCNDSATGKRCADILEEIPGFGRCTCQLTLKLNEDFKKEVFLYYGLSNYYQNHRRYVKSRDDRQLLGRRNLPSAECEPFAYKRFQNQTAIPIAPCGAIANSLFNDTFELRWQIPNQKSADVPVLRTGIAWSTDINSKFRNPPLESPTQNLSVAFKDTTKPPNWNKYVWQLDPKNKNEDNGYENEPFIIWMRTAALPNFRKIYGRVAHNLHDSEAYFLNSLPKGTYQLTVSYNYPVKSFRGTKRFIISNTSWLGGKNPFLGVTYIVIGIICLLLSGIFVFIHKKFGKSNSEVLNINQRTPYMS